MLKKIKKFLKNGKKILHAKNPSSQFVVLKEGGVYFPALNLVAISDLQLGHEAVLHNKGIDVPISQLPIIIERIKSMLMQTNAKRLLINGDIKHEFSNASQQEWDDVLELISVVRKIGAEIILVRGNHDNYIQKILRNQNLKLRDYFFESGILFVHGHKRLEDYGDFPELKKFKTLAIGHIHPAVSIIDEVDFSHKYNCVLRGEFRNKELIILPSISPLASGTDLTRIELRLENHSPILDECDLGEFIPTVIDEEAGIREFPKLKYL